MDFINKKSDFTGCQDPCQAPFVPEMNHSPHFRWNATHLAHFKMNLGNFDISWWERVGGPK